MTLDRHLKTLFIREIQRQCNFGMMAAKRLEDALNKPDMEEVWFYCQALLSAVGNTSKLLWPPAEKISGRGDELRLALGVGPNSALAVRTFRNHFEHFDERIEEWASSTIHHNFADSNVIPLSAISGIDAGDFLRNLDPSTRSLTFRGDTYDLVPVVAELNDLYLKATAALGLRSGKPPQSGSPSPDQ
ncbi:MAG TPA: hypothetical protein VGG32_10280 [Thermoplasmata archaeon]|jgi:hypothetical protein